MFSRNIFYFLFTIVFNFLFLHEAFSQGCVAIRHFSACSPMMPQGSHNGEGDWQVGMNYRYFKSFRHFRGTHEEPDRVANSTEVINHSHAWDFSITYMINSRWYANVILPFVMNSRSSLYEHGRNERNSTFSRGMADMRIAAGYRLFDPERTPNSQLALGLGIKLPTGDYNASDIFYNVGPEESPEVRPVDQSIQPGDGGFGVTLDFQFFQSIRQHLFVYGNGFYLINPRETNGIRTFRETLSPILQNESIMSVPDQYSVRAGLNYNLPSLAAGFSMGMRYEGVPVEDLIGGNNGFRRPGNVLSIEPGINYMKGPISFNLSVPVAIRRNRPQSVTDRNTELTTGEPRNGDAAFADYLVSFNMTYHIQKRKAPAFPDLNRLENQ